MNKSIDLGSLNQFLQPQNLPQVSPSVLDELKFARETYQTPRTRERLTTAGQSTLTRTKLKRQKIVRPSRETLGTVRADQHYRAVAQVNEHLNTNFLNASYDQTVALKSVKNQLEEQQRGRVQNKAESSRRLVAAKTEDPQSKPTQSLMSDTRKNMIKIARICFRCMDKFSAVDISQCLLGMGIEVQDESLYRMAENTMLDLGCEAIGMNEIVSIGVGDVRTKLIAKILRELYPKETVQQLDDQIQIWYDSLLNEDYEVTTKAAATKLFALGFGRSEMRVKKGRASPIGPGGIIKGQSEDETLQSLKACGAGEIIQRKNFYRMFDMALFMIALRKLGVEMVKQEVKGDETCGRILEYKRLTQRRDPTPDFSKATVRPIKFAPPKPLPKIKR